MAAGTTTATRVMDRIGALAAAVDGIDAARVYQGRKVFAAGEDPDASLRDEATETEAAFTFWIGAREVGTQTRPGILTVRGRMQIAMDAYASSDANAAYEILEALLAALNTESAFANLGARPIRPSGYRESEEVYPDGIVLFEIILTYEVGVAGGA